MSLWVAFLCWGAGVKVLEVVSENFALSQVRAFFSRLRIYGRVWMHTGRIIVNLLVMLAQHPLPLPTVKSHCSLSVSDLSPHDSDHVSDHTSYSQCQQFVPRSRSGLLSDAIPLTTDIKDGNMTQFLQWDVIPVFILKLWVRETFFYSGPAKLKDCKPRAIRGCHMEKTYLKVPVTQKKATEYVMRSLLKPLKPTAFEEAHSCLSPWPKLVWVGFWSHATRMNWKF